MLKYDAAISLSRARRPGGGGGGGANRRNIAWERRQYDGQAPVCRLRSILYYIIYPYNPARRCVVNRLPPLMHGQQIRETLYDDGDDIATATFIGPCTRISVCASVRVCVCVCVCVCVRVCVCSLHVSYIQKYYNGLPPRLPNTLSLYMWSVCVCVCVYVFIL
jgi:hypothetical protein